MLGPGLAESDAVTFFVVPLVSWLPEDNSRESKTKEKIEQT